MFGFAGNDVYSEDTVFSTGLEAIEGLSGTFSVIDPRINFNYENSFGMPVGLDLYIQGYFTGREYRYSRSSPAGHGRLLIITCSPMWRDRCNTTAQTYPTSVNC